MPIRIPQGFIDLQTTIFLVQTFYIVTTTYPFSIAFAQLMGSLQALIPSLTYILAVFLLLFPSYLIAQDDTPMRYNGYERDALYALKAELNYPFLNKNWNGLHCYMNSPSRWYGIRCFNGRVTDISLEGMGLTGHVNVYALVNLTELSILSFKNNRISGKVMDFTSNTKLTRVDLSNNMFDGHISSSLLGLNMLESLQLQGNNLTGQIPQFSHQGSLREFNVSNNKLWGEIPQTELLQSFHFSSYFGNLDLCGPPSPNTCDSSSSSNSPPAPSTKKNFFTKTTFVGIFVLLSVIAVTVVVVCFLRYCKKVKNVKKEMEVVKVEVEVDNKKKIESVERRAVNGRGEERGKSTRVERRAVISGGEERGTSTRVERRAVIGGGEERGKSTRVERRAVNGGVGEERGKRTTVERRAVSGGGEERGKLTFMDEEGGIELKDLLKASAEGLGKGNFGNTYKAMLDNGPDVVVKRLRDLKPLSREEFAKQMRVMADLKHPNLLPLIAYYYTKDEKLLVYKFAQNGNLFNRIHGGRRGNRIPFKWNSRLLVAQGVARAMDFLHRNNKSQTDVILLHGNLKPSNILLDANDVALVSDYGLASLISLPIAAQRMTSYKSPEYQQRKKISTKSDVWSYGCLLLELITGRISTHSAPPGVKGVDLSSWVHRAVREEWTAEIFDVEICLKRNAAQGMLRLLQIAIKCCDKLPEKRPDMAEVVREIEHLRTIDSEDDNDTSYDQSLTEDSLSTTASGIIGEER